MLEPRCARCRGASWSRRRAFAVSVLRPRETICALPQLLGKTAGRTEEEPLLSPCHSDVCNTPFFFDLCRGYRSRVRHPIRGPENSDGVELLPFHLVDARKGDLADNGFSRFYCFVSNGVIWVAAAGCNPALQVVD